MVFPMARKEDQELNSWVGSVGQHSCRASRSARIPEINKSSGHRRNG